MASSAAQETTAEGPPQTTSSIQADILDSVEEDYPVDENTPLLAAGDEEQGESPAPTRSKAIYVLTILSLTFSVTTLVLGGVSGFLKRLYGLWWSYTLDDAFYVAITGTILALVISSFNFSRLRKFRDPAPILINIVLDFVIFWYIVVNCLGGLINGPYYFSGGPLVVKVMLGLVFGTAVVVGIEHFILFILRVRLFFISGAWQAPWSFPTGQVTLEFTVKVLRQAQRSVSPERGQGE